MEEEEMQQNQRLYYVQFYDLCFKYKVINKFIRPPSSF